MSLIFPNDSFLRLRAALAVDMHDLTGELVRQPAQLMEACEQCVEATRERDQAERVVKLETTLSAAKLRSTLIDGKKLAETAIAAEAPLAEEVQQAVLFYEDAKAAASHWGNLVMSLQAKQSSLKRLAELTVSGYLAAGSGSSYESQRAGMAEARRAASEGGGLRRRPLNGGA